MLAAARRDRDPAIALAEAAMAGAGDDELAALDVAASDHVPAGAVEGIGTFLDDEHEGELLAPGADPDEVPDDAESRIAHQAGQQSDHHDSPQPASRERDPEY